MALLTRLRIAGFKSFAEPASVDILPGLTGIVGPNGCGKSNVVEALRWAMGENSPARLRGGEMDDVIFAGTAARASRNLAEVTITLTSGGRCRRRRSTTSRTERIRRIERGAGSSYRGNGREMRARDVQTLFADLASGARSSAWSARDACRAGERQARGTAAGAGGSGRITGLHARRHEAELKLRAAEANLARADDLRDTARSGGRSEEAGPSGHALSQHLRTGARRGDELWPCSMRAPAGRGACGRRAGGSLGIGAASRGRAGSGRRGTRAVRSDAAGAARGGGAGAQPAGTAAAGSRNALRRGRTRGADPGRGRSTAASCRVGSGGCGRLPRMRRPTPQGSGPKSRRSRPNPLHCRRRSRRPKRPSRRHAPKRCRRSTLRIRPPMQRQRAPLPSARRRSFWPMRSFASTPRVRRMRRP